MLSLGLTITVKFMWEPRMQIKMLLKRKNKKPSMPKKDRRKIRAQLGLLIEISGLLATAAILASTYKGEDLKIALSACSALLNWTTNFK
jgi:hypothetical protein